MKRTLAALTAVCAIGGLVGLYGRLHGVQFLGTGNVSLQASPVTCGPAAVVYVLMHFGIAAAEDEVAVIAGTTGNGTTLLGLARAVEAYGLRPRGVRASYSALSGVPLPAIAVFKGHYVVIKAVSPLTVVVGDPLIGVVRYGRKAFERVWTGQLLLVERG